jgi:hypothetical protein
MEQLDFNQMDSREILGSGFSLEYVATYQRWFDLEQNNKYFTWYPHKYMIVVATNVTVLFLWPQ